MDEDVDLDLGLPSAAAAAAAASRLDFLSSSGRTCSAPFPYQSPSAVAAPSSSLLQRPRYFLLMKYLLMVYIISHLIWITVTLPSGMRELTETAHVHREEIRILWITSIVYCSIFSLIGLIGIWKENFLTCFVYCLSMLINLLLLVYAAVLHRDQSSSMIAALVANWFFTSVAIAFTKILDSLQHDAAAAPRFLQMQSFSSLPSPPFLLESSPGYLHSIYIRRDHHVTSGGKTASNMSPSQSEPLSF